MFNGRWRAYVALGIILFLSLSSQQGNGEPRHQENQRPNSEPTSGDHLPKVSTLTVHKVFQAGTPQNQTEFPTPEKVFGLSYEGWIALFTLVLTLATVGLFAATFLLWKETQRLAKGAEMQAEDVKTSLDIGRQSAEAAIEAVRNAKHSDRAWVLAMPPVLDGGDVNAATKETKIRFRWKNCGNSPAMGAKFWCRSRTIKDGDPVPEPNFIDLGDIISTNIGPGDTHEMEGASILHEDVSLLVGKGGECFLFTRVEYFDIFERDVLRVTEACYWVKHVRGKPYAVSFIPTQVAKNTIT